MHRRQGMSVSQANGSQEVKQARNGKTKNLKILSRKGKEALAHKLLKQEAEMHARKKNGKVYARPQQKLLKRFKWAHEYQAWLESKEKGLTNEPEPRLNGSRENDPKNRLSGESNARCSKKRIGNAATDANPFDNYDFTPAEEATRIRSELIFRACARDLDTYRYVSQQLAGKPTPSTRRASRGPREYQYALASTEVNDERFLAVVWEALVAAYGPPQDTRKPTREIILAELEKLFG